MSAVFLGDLSASAPHDTKYSFVPFRGWITTWTYTGTEASIFTVADAFSVSRTGASLELTQNGPLWILVVTFDYKNDGTSVETPVNTWELLGNDIQKDIYEHPTSLALGVNLLSAVRSGVDSVAKASPGSEQQAITAALANIKVVADSLAVIPGLTNAEVASELFNLIVKGTTHYSTSQFVLRRTQTVSNTYQTKFAINDVEYLYTTEQLKAEIEIPNTLVFELSEIPEPPERSGFLWSWLKRSPQTQFVVGGRIQVTQEYWLEQWSTYLYFTKL